MGTFGSVTPGRAFSSTSYRYGFNDKEKDDETYGAGNAYDFGDRIYDPRLGKWLSLDPLAKKYAGLSSYAYTFNNPIIFMDLNGKDGRLSVDYDKKQVTLETTIFIYGGDKSIDYTQLAAKYNEAYSNMNNTKQVKDANGETWTVAVNVKFVYDATIEQNYAATGATGADRITTGTTEGITANSGFKPGDNTLKVNTQADLGKSTEGISAQGFNEAQVSTTDQRVGIHEVFHELGYSDRYDTKTGLSMYPEGGLMLSGGGGGGGSDIADYQFVDLLDFAMKNANGKSGTMIMGEKTTFVPEVTTPGTNGAPDVVNVAHSVSSSNLILDVVDNRSSKQRDTDVKKSERVSNVPKSTTPKKK